MTRTGWLVVGVAIGIGAAILRLLWLPTRGRFDADQGDQLLVVMSMVRTGDVPLLGPTTFLPGFHHGALYYWALAPAAAISDSDPAIITLTFVLAGLIAVAGTAWLAHGIGGPVAGLAAAAIAAVSATAVFASVTIWNPHLVPAAAAVGLAGAWTAFDRRQPRWWIVAGIGLSVAIQFHVLAVVLLPSVVGLFIADARRTGAESRGRLLAGGGLGLVAVGVGFLPLAIHELSTGGAELRVLLDYLFGGAAAEGAGGSGALARLPIVLWRTIAFPLVGTFTDAPIASIACLVGVLAVIVWRLRAGDARERAGMAFLAATLGIGWVLLTLGVPSLATVIRELPVDHYHAALDPVVIAIAGLGIGAAIGAVRREGVARAVGAVPSVAGVVVLVVIVGWNLATQPPASAPDGGWPAAEAAGARLIDTADGSPMGFVSRPVAKTAGAYRFAVERARATVVPAAALRPGETLVALCDDAFRETIGADCGGPAEDAAAADRAPPGTTPTPIDRFSPSPGRHLSAYRLD